MVKLGDALAFWKPGSGGGGTDPLSVIRAAWTEIVGADVARAAQPVELRSGALLVLSASSAWSHQLAFLERDILRAVAALGVAEVDRLRFRVGTIRTPVRGVRGGRPALSAGAAHQPAGTPRSPAEALARLRSLIEAQRAAHARGGGTFCAQCGAPIAGGGRCRPCADADERARREACERILFEAPWLESSAIFALVPGLDAEAYDAIRRGLLRRWLDELRLARRRHAAAAPIDPVRIRKLASSFVLLETRVDPNYLELDSPVRRNALGELYPFIREIEKIHS